MSLDQLKLNKTLVTAMSEAGYLTPKEIQAKSMSRILGGQDIIAVAPAGSGKTTTYVAGVLNRLKFSRDEAPKVLILVADKDRGLLVIEAFSKLSRNRDLRIIGLFGPGGTEAEINELLDGMDIVVALPTRARAIYLKLGLNLNRLQTFIVDDAELIVKQGMQLPVCELARSAGKVQHLVFTSVMHQKLSLMTDQFMNFPVILEADELQGNNEVNGQLLYEVPNFRTKVNLLNLLLADHGRFEKVIVFVNTRLTAQNLSKSLYSNNPGEISVLNPLIFSDPGFDNLSDFIEQPLSRVVVVANEGPLISDILGIPAMIHFEIPEKQEHFLGRIVQPEQEITDSIIFATDMELIEVRKIEQSVGSRFPVAELPSELIIDKGEKTVAVDKNRIQKEENLPGGNGAFHEKKKSNSKDFNFGIGQKAVMNKKKKHG